jgi:hypothetical protein
MRNEGEVPKEFVTTAANHNRGRKSDPEGSSDGLADSLATVFRGLAEEPGLERENVIEHAIDTPALEAVVGDHTGPLELAPQRNPKRSVDS